MRTIFDLVGGVWELLGLAVRARFRLGMPYWRWRRETAFGTDPARLPPARQRWLQMLRYGIWVHRMKRAR